MYKQLHYCPFQGYYEGVSNFFPQNRRLSHDKAQWSSINHFVLMSPNLLGLSWNSSLWWAIFCHPSGLAQMNAEIMRTTETVNLDIYTII